MSNPKADNSLTNLYLYSLITAGAAVIFLSILNLTDENIDTKFFVLTFITIFASSNLQIQLPRTKIHLSFSEVVTIYLMLTYGVGGAVLLAAAETGFTTFNMNRKGISIKYKTYFLNIAINAISVFLTAITIKILFSSPLPITAEMPTVVFILLLLGTGGGLFLYNSVIVSVWAALKTEQPLRGFWEYWFESCMNTLVLFIAAALIAGLAIEAQSQLNAALFLLAMVVAGVVYFTYRRYVDAVKTTSAKAEEAERERAEQAEKHVEELQHHIAEQDRISQALRQSKESFRHAAFHDALTDLPNRNPFIEKLEFSLEKTKQQPNFKFAVLFLDINRFKTINDSLGHSMGDRLILQVAKRLATSVRERDLVARFSGDEFAFILNRVDGVEDAIKFAQRIKEKFSAPFSLHGRQIFTSFSIGIAMGNADYEAAADVLRDADIAMYHAKEADRDYVVFDTKMHTRAVTLLQLETDLRVAIERGQLEMFYQPIVKLDSMQLLGFESLVRWNHPQRGLVPPSEFISVSEDTGLIIPMTLWILRTSCRQLVEWQRKYPEYEDLVISVNLSGKHFAQKNLVEQIKAILDETQIKPGCLKLELTESAMMENAERVILMLMQIRELGIQLSIDDFGTGYSSLSYLHRFPINTLKVDRSFVSTMEDGSENGEIVRTIIALAKTLKLDVIAEGIETIHQLHQLRVLGCEYGQGYLFSRPVPVSEAEKLIGDKLRWNKVLPDNPMKLPVPEVGVPHLRLAK